MPENEPNSTTGTASDGTEGADGKGPLPQATKG